MIFKEAMNDGMMENYFKLASQFRTQDEPAFCGLATLVMVLNALEIDPGRVWKGPWRWYHEHMLDCCIPIEEVKTKGITFDQFACLSRCNGLEIGNERRLSGELGRDREEMGLFEKVVGQVCAGRGLDEVLVVSYSRAAVGQTGGGHFCAVGGFHRYRRLVLLMDTARFKYPPHWVPLEALWLAMSATDGETGLGRGYMTVRRASDWGDAGAPPLLLVTAVEMNELLMTGATVDKLAPISAFVRHWSDWVNTRVSVDHTHDDGEHLLLVKDTAAAIFDWMLLEVRNSQSNELAPFALTCRTDLSDGAALSNRDIQEAIAAIVKDVLECPIGTAVAEVASALDSGDRRLLCDRAFLLPRLSGCSSMVLQDEIQKLAFLASSWIMVASPVLDQARASAPVSATAAATATRGELLQHACSRIVHSRMSRHCRTELQRLSAKIAKMYKYHDWRASGRKQSVCGAA